MEVSGRGVLITGASRGLGAALATELAGQGARLVLVARGEQALSDVVGAIRNGGGQAHAIAADVGSKDDVYAIAGAASSLVGEVDIVVHDASTLGAVPLRMLADTTCEDLERVLAVNVVGPFRLTKALAGPMLLRGRALGSLRRLQGRARSARAHVGRRAPGYRRAVLRSGPRRDGHGDARRRDSRRGPIVPR
jgi:NAD(P)-dependent dehydrogenase (short-subunit alcohol dehydrogenase family)